MSEIIDLDERFNDWFFEEEGFAGHRSGRFYDTIDLYEDKTQRYEYLVKWLKAAYLHGIHVASQDSVETLYDYATACAGLEAKLTTATEDYDSAAASLASYWCDVLKDDK